MPPSPATIEALRRQIATSLAASLGNREVLPFGDPRIDGHLPGGGLPIGQLHEIGADGIEAETGAVAGGFAAVLAGALVRHASDERVLLWIAPCCDLYAPGLLPYGIDPGRLILAQTRTDDETLQAMETALRSGAAAVVLGEVGKLSRLAARRLQLASLQEHTTSLVLRRWPHGRPRTRPDATAAVTRWRVSHVPAESRARAPGLLSPSLRWRVELLHARGGRCGDWIMEVGDAAGSLRVVAVLGDHQVAPRARVAGQGGAG